MQLSQPLAKTRSASRISKNVCPCSARLLSETVTWRTAAKTPVQFTGSGSWDDGSSKEMVFISSGVKPPKLVVTPFLKRKVDWGTAFHAANPASICSSAPGKALVGLRDITTGDPLSGSNHRIGGNSERVKPSCFSN